MPDIDFQKIELNLIPKKGEQPVVFYASQYETARPFIAVLKWGDSEFAPGVDCYAEIDIRKNDDNLVVITDDVSIDNNEVSVILPVQALTCIGKNLGQVKIYGVDNNLIAALNFILEVQADPLAGGVTSETAIDNLKSQIGAIVPEVIGDDYYNKTETDALLANKANMSDLASLASKAELTQAILDEDIALKNWVSLNFATTGYVNERIFNMLPVGSASGNPCIFNTEIAAALQALTAEIVASGGNGTPDNPILIVGHSEINLDVNGQTFTVQFGQTVYGGVYDKSGRLTITFVGFDMGTAEWGRGNRNHDDTGRIFSIVKADAKPASNSTIIADCFKYNGYQSSWENLNVGDIEINSSKVIILCANCETVEELQQTFNGRIIAYELATPIVIDVPSISVYAENGVNNIVSDCLGDVSVSYKDTIQHYIDERL